MTKHALRFFGFLFLFFISRAALAQSPPELLVPGISPFDMDVGSGAIGWTEVAIEACSPPYALKWVDTFGYPATVFSGCITQATELRIDGSYFYYIDSQDSTLRTVSRYSGAAPQVLASAPGSAFAGPANMVVSGSYVYWGDDGGIHRVPKYPRSGAVQNLVLAPLGYHNAHYWLAVDDAYVYWVEGAAGNRSIRRASINGGGGGATLITSLQQPQYLAVDSLYLYWADAGARIFRMPKGGGGWTSYNSANTNFSATGLVVDDTHVYWSQYGPPLTDTVILRRAIKNSAAVTDMLIGRNAGYLRQDAYSLYWRDNDGIKRIRKDSVAVTMDFRLQGIEVTQGVQDLANSVPLVANKQTFVRVYPGATFSGIARQTTTALLRGVRNGVDLPGSPLRPVSPLLTVVNNAGIDRAMVSNSFLFTLPPAWLSNTVVLTAEINPARSLPETTFANNTISVTNTFTRKPSVGLYTVAMTTRDNPGDVLTVRDPAVRQAVRRFSTLYPTARVWLRPMAGVNGPWNLPADQDWAMFSLIVNYLGSAEFNDGAAGPGDKTHVVGMVSGNSSTGVIAGYGNFCVPMSFVKMITNTYPGSPFGDPDGGRVLAQEVAHNYNGWPYWPTEGNTRWQHVRCGTTNQLNPNYPYPPNQLGFAGTNRAYGFDPISLMAIAPDGGAADFMSYCAPVWVSDYNWRGLFNNMDTLTTMDARTKTSLGETGGGAQVLLLGGQMMGDGSVHWFGPAYGMDSTLLDANRFALFQKAQQQWTFTGASYTLDQLNGDGKVLTSQAFEPFPPEEHDEAVPARGFCLVLPQDPNVRKIQVALKGKPLATLPVSLNAPVTSVTSPKTGTYASPFLLSWVGKDPDGDTLTYSVQFSANAGVTWQMLAFNITDDHMLIDPANLPGGPNCYLRVIATDGVNTGFALSQPFAVEGHTPMAFIDSPADTQMFRAGDQITFNGDGYDLEDGVVPDARLTWSVDKLGFVGNGRIVTIPGLAPGAYVVKLDAADSNKNLASTSIRIVVTEQGEAPRLSIAPGSKDILLSWPFSAQDYILESTDQLNPAKWSPVGSTPVLIEESNTVPVPYGSTTRFYRLRNVNVK